MTVEFQFWPTATFVGAMLNWLVYLGVFLFRKNPPQAREQKREAASRLGIALQALGYGIALVVWRPPFTSLVPMPELAQAALAFATPVLGLSSVGIILAAVRALGKHWSYAARLVEGHKLVITGPYSRVRHPIYTGMLGLLLATGLAVSRWYALVAAVLVFAIGTAIRIRCEEKLLQEAFGDDFAACKRYIPALFPRLF